MLTYQSNIMPSSDSINKISAVTFSANNKKLAVANSEKVIMLLDENYEAKDKIQTKGAERENKNYIIRALEFSPDSSILAVAQSDNIIYSYKLGLEWGEKKSICSKIVTTSSVTCMAWPKNSPHELFFGQADGVIKTGFLKTHKSQTIYSTDSYVVSMAVDKQSKNLVSGHLDGQIYIYNIEAQSFRRLINAGTVPYALGLTKNIIFSGSNCILSIVDKSGNIVQRFDYSNKENSRDFNGLYINPSGDSMVLTGFSQFLIYNFNSKRQEWEENGVISPNNYYSITSGCWKGDGSKFISANMCGSVDVFDVSIKRLNFKGKFELNYLSSSKVRITSMDKGANSVVSSQRGLEIVNVEILKDRYVVALTSSTIILGDLYRNKISEVEWIGGGNEKFEFNSYDLCWVSNAGEVSVIELGRDEILGSFRTEYTTKRLISVVSKHIKNSQDKQYVAYLLDSQTIRVLNLINKVTEVTIDHDSKIVWLDFNPNATKVLFKDGKKNLYLYCLNSREKINLLSFCGLCCWIEDSDVVIAQSKGSLNIWYSSDTPDKKSIIPIRGTFVEVKTKPKLSATVLDGNIETSIELDDLLMKFGYAIENKNMAACLSILENRGRIESEGHWRNLLRMAEQEANYTVVERCHVALGDIPKAEYFHKINKKIRDFKKNGMSKEEIENNYEIKASIAALEGQFHKAESIYMQNNVPDKAIEMYQEIHRWDDSLRIAQETQKEDFQGLKESYLEWLLQTGQEEKAAELYENEGSFAKSADLFLKAKLPARAASLIKKFNISADEDIVKKVTKQLQESEMFEVIAELREHYNDNPNAISFYIKAGVYHKALEIAKKSSPEQIITIEEKWGDHLMSQNQKESAVNHFIEARCNKKALDAAIACHQWQKAIALLSGLNSDDFQNYCIQIAKQLEQGKQYDLAEKYFMKAKKNDLAFKMYINAKKMKEAMKFGKENFKQEELNDLCEKQAKDLEKNSKYEEAEKLYVEIKHPELAIKMYKNLGHWDKMLKLFSIYRPENLKEAHNWIGKKLEEEDQLSQAEKHFLEAGAWTAAVDMYEKRKLFEDCLRICKNFASDRDTVERAKRWDSIIGEEELTDLLKKAGLVDSLIDYFCEKKRFTDAFKLSERAKHKLPDVHLSYAMHLEDEHRYKDAEKEYILAGKYDQVVHMYIDIGDYTSALQIARQYDHGLLEEIYLKQAKIALEHGDLEKMEIFFISARKPEMAVTTLTKLGQLSDALRVARKHCPHMVKEINNSLEQKTTNIEQMSGTDIMKQAKLWEEAREWEKVIDLYLEISEKHFNDVADLEFAWDKAVQIAYNFLPSRYIETVKIVCKRLRDFQRYIIAGEYYETIQMYEEAIKCFIAANDYEKAKKCCQKINDGSLQATMKELVDKSFKNFLRVKGDAEQLVGNEEVRDGLDLMAQRGEWIQVLSIAKSKSDELLGYYMQKFLEDSMDNGRFAEALKILVKFEMQFSSNLLNSYRKLIDETFALCEPTEITDLKICLQQFCQKISNLNIETAEKEEFEKYLLVSHLIQLKQIYEKHKLTKLNAEVSISLTRYIDLTTIDKPFYDAGLALRDDNDEIQSFMFFNRYLDIYEAIEDPSNNIIEENEEFSKSDIPNLLDLRLPRQNMISEKEKIEIRDWLLNISMKKSSDLKLPKKSCNNCSQSIYANNISCPYCHYKEEPCYLTGLPLRSHQTASCKECKKKFNSESYKLFISYFSHCPWCEKEMMK
jgi:intraflagellar transport protein 172